MKPRGQHGHRSGVRAMSRWEMSEGCDHGMRSLPEDPAARQVMGAPGQHAAWSLSGAQVRGVEAGGGIKPSISSISKPQGGADAGYRSADLRRSVDERWRSPAARFVLALLEQYQTHASPGLRASCRYSPSCSEYARRAVERHGAIRGILRAFARWRRCKPPFAGVDEP